MAETSPSSDDDAAVVSVVSDPSSLPLSLPQAATTSMNANRMADIGRSFIHLPLVYDGGFTDVSKHSHEIGCVGKATTDV